MALSRSILRSGSRAYCEASLGSVIVPGTAILADYWANVSPMVPGTENTVIRKMSPTFLTFIAKLFKASYFRVVYSHKRFPCSEWLPVLDDFRNFLDSHDAITLSKELIIGK